MKKEIIEMEKHFQEQPLRNSDNTVVPGLPEMLARFRRSFPSLSSESIRRIFRLVQSSAPTPETEMFAASTTPPVNKKKQPQAKKVR
jgi:hypothetical protein